MQQNLDLVGRFSEATWPHTEHSCDEYAAGTCSTTPPWRSVLYSSIDMNRPGATSSSARLSPAFCATFRPGSDSVPLADRVMFFNFKSSITTTLWFLA